MEPLKVLVKTPFSQYSGYGADGYSLVRALHQWGCDVYVQPVWVDVPIPRDLLHLFAKTLVGPFDLTINHWDPAHLDITRQGREMTRVALAWTMWEFSGGPGKNPADRPEGEPVWKPPSEEDSLLRSPLKDADSDEVAEDQYAPVSGVVPHCEARGSLRKRLRFFDMVLGYDQVTLDALGPYIHPKVQQGVLQGGYDSKDWKYFGDRDWHGKRFAFIMHGALAGRKCPWTSIQAFNELKWERPEEFEGATLALHTSMPGDIFPELNKPFEKQKIRVFVDVFDKQTLDEFYYSAHCLLSPSRGEGKNLPALEFQTTGGVVAATNFGGHTQWLNADWAYPLDYTLGPTFPDKPWAAQDAKVSIAHMKDVIWHIYTHREEARRKAELAAELIPKMCDWQVVLEGLFRRVRDHVRGPGPDIYDQAMACRRQPQQPQQLMAPAGWQQG